MTEAKLKVVFFGTPDFVIPVLESIWKNHKLLAVVTQPPKIAGRGQKFRAFSPVDNWAHKRRITVITDLSKSDLPEAELGVLAGYGKIIPESVINHFKYGILNIHPSILPKYRGASPVQGAILAGDIQTGVTVIKMDKELDHGPIVSQFKEEIAPTDTSEALTKRLFERSAQFLINLIPNFINGKTKIREQDHVSATFTKILKKEDGFVDFKDLQNPEKSVEIDRKMRSLNPWPGVWSKLKDGKRLKILKAHLDDNKLALDEVQMEGKNPVKWKQFESVYASSHLS